MEKKRKRKPSSYILPTTSLRFVVIETSQSMFSLVLYLCNGKKKKSPAKPYFPFLHVLKQADSRFSFLKFMQIIKHKGHH